MKKLFSLISLILISSSAILAQEGTLSGKIIDGKSKTKDGVSFATVVLVRGGTQVTGAIADYDGNYIIKPITPGTYDLKVSSVGFPTSTLTGIQIEADKIKTVDVTLFAGIELAVTKIWADPLVDPDKTSTGGTASHTEIQQSAINRSNPNNIAAKTA